MNDAKIKQHTKDKSLKDLNERLERSQQKIIAHKKIIEETRVAVSAIVTKIDFYNDLVREEEENIQTIQLELASFNNVLSPDAEPALQKNIYLLSQTERNGYDTYDSCVVIATSDEEARNVSIKQLTFGWVDDLTKIDCELIGTALPTTQVGIVLSSFNAG